MAKYLAPIKWLGGAIVVVLLFGLFWGPISGILFSETTRASVLIQSIPFVAIFVCILLAFILLIFLVAIRFNGKIPYRSYSGVEYTIIIAIGLSVVCLFQPWTIVPYRYGFILLIAATLGFILWSHVTPANPQLDETRPKLTQQQQLVAGIAGLVVVLFLTFSAATVNAPQSPYGLRQRIWDTYTPEKQATLAEEATRSFQTIEVPFLLVFNLFPASIVYFVTRELVGNGKRKNEDDINMPIATRSGIT